MGLEGWRDLGSARAVRGRIPDRNEVAMLALSM